MTVRSRRLKLFSFGTVLAMVAGLFALGPFEVAFAYMALPTGTLAATYDTATGTLSVSGQYSWPDCTPSNTSRYVGFSIFIDGPDADGAPGRPPQSPPTAEALDGAGMHVANGGNPCTSPVGPFSDGSHNKVTNPILASPPTLACVVTYDVRKNSSGAFVASGWHSITGAGSNRNIDNSFDLGGGYGLWVAAGRIDINGSLTISSADDGMLFGKTVIDARVDWDGNGTVNGLDDSPGADFGGKRVIDGLVDMNGDGVISKTDIGRLGRNPAECVAPTVVNSDNTPPTCTWQVFAGPPRTAEATVTDGGSGIVSIQVLDGLNVTVEIPKGSGNIYAVDQTAMISPPQAQVIVLATKIDQGAASRVSVRVRDAAGNDTGPEGSGSPCDPTF